MPDIYYRLLRYLPGSWAYCADMAVALPRVFLHRVSVVVPCHHSGFAVGHDDGQFPAELEVGACIPSVSSRQLEVVHQSGRIADGS